MRALLFLALLDLGCASESSWSFYGGLNLSGGDVGGGTPPWFGAWEACLTYCQALPSQACTWHTLGEPTAPGLCFPKQASGFLVRLSPHALSAAAPAVPVPCVWNSSTLAGNGSGRPFADGPGSSSTFGIPFQIAGSNVSGGVVCCRLFQQSHQSGDALGPRAHPGGKWGSWIR
jgi:hypothetical protein